MLKGLGYLVFAIGLFCIIPKYYRNYKQDKNIEDLLFLIGIILLGAGSLMLSLSELMLAH